MHILQCCLFLNSMKWVPKTNQIQRLHVRTIMHHVIFSNSKGLTNTSLLLINPLPLFVNEECLAHLTFTLECFFCMYTVVKYIEF